MFREENGVYTCSNPEIYYDGYKIKADVGAYKLTGLSNDKYQKINSTSKLSFSDNRNIEPKKVEKIDDLGEIFFERHSLLKKYENYNAISVDLDNDEKNEKIVCFSDQNKGTRIIVFDNNDEVIVTLVDLKDGKHSFEEIIELVDLDGDKVTEIVTKAPLEREVSISKYQGGYYFPKIIYY